MPLKLCVVERYSTDLFQFLRGKGTSVYPAAAMTYWLQVENVSVQPWALRVVTTESQATQLSSADAREAVKGAQREYPDCVWVTVPLAGDRCLVAGEAKPKPYAG